MAYLRIILLASTIVLSTKAFAQNEIDRLVDHYSTMGSSTFTSAVERDPKTHKIVKTVKTLKTRGHDIGEIKNAFERESHTGNFSKKKEDDKTKMVLTVQTEKANRVYMLTYSSSGHSFHEGKATIIVKVRNALKKEQE